MSLKPLWERRCLQRFSILYTPLAHSGHVFEAGFSVEDLWKRVAMPVRVFSLILLWWSLFWTPRQHVSLQQHHTPARQEHVPAEPEGSWRFPLLGSNWARKKSSRKALLKNSQALPKSAGMFSFSLVLPCTSRSLQLNRSSLENAFENKWNSLLPLSRNCVIPLTLPCVLSHDPRSQKFISKTKMNHIYYF